VPAAAPLKLPEGQATHALALARLYDDGKHATRVVVAAPPSRD
jgi:hypothetical protein